MSALWTQLSRFESVAIHKPITTGNKEYVIINKNGIYKYLVQTDEWIKYIAFSAAHIPLDYVSCAYDKYLHILYIYSGGKFLEINLKTKQITCHPLNEQYDGDFAKVTVINSELHIIGGFCCDPHIIWNRSTSKYTTVTDRIGATQYDQYPLVNIEHKKLLIRKRDKSIYNVYNYGKDIQAMCFSVIDNTDYMVLFEKSSIFIVDINTWNIYRSMVIPEAVTIFSSVNVFGVENDVDKESIVHGYILVNYDNFANEFPRDLVNLLLMYYSQIYVHFVSDNNDSNCKIALDDLLCDMCFMGVFWTEMNKE